MNDDDQILTCLSLCHANLLAGIKKPDRYQVGNGKSALWLGSLLQTGNVIGGSRQSRQSGNNPAATEVTLSFKWASILLITAGSSPRRPQAILARACPASGASALGMILTSPPHSRQVSPKVGAIRRCQQGELMRSIKRECPGVYRTSVSNTLPRSWICVSRQGFGLVLHLRFRPFFLYRALQE